MSIFGKWGFSKNCEGGFLGACDSWWEAALEGFADYPHLEEIHVGEYVEPGAPESYIDGDWVIEHVCCQDDYCHDWADGWPGSTKEQEDELTDMLRRAFGDWLDKHELRPKFGLVEDIRKVTKTEARDARAHAVERSEAGIGRTSEQMLSSPHGAYFLCPRGIKPYMETLARHLGRSDLKIVTPSWLWSRGWMGRDISGVVRDHATYLTAEEWAVYDELLTHALRAENPDRAPTQPETLPGDGSRPNSRLARLTALRIWKSCRRTPA